VGFKDFIFNSHTNVHFVPTRIPPDEDWIKINRDGTVVQYGLKAVRGGVTHKGDKWKIYFGVFS
jgi:hypothetical protein